MASRKKPPDFEMPPSSRKEFTPAAAAGAPAAGQGAEGDGATSTAAGPQATPLPKEPVGWVYRSDRQPDAAPVHEAPAAAPAAAPAVAPTHWLERAVMQTLGSSYLLLLMPLSWRPLRRPTKPNPKE